MNAQVVRRSHALLNPGGGELAYVEVALHSSFGKAFVEFVGLGMFATALVRHALCTGRVAVPASLPPLLVGPGEISTVFRFCCLGAQVSPHQHLVP